MLVKDALIKAAKVVAARRGDSPDSWNGYGDRLLEEGAVRHRFVNGGESEWLVVEDDDWWAIQAGRVVKAGPFDTKAELLTELRTDTSERVASGKPGQAYVDGLYRVRGDLFAVRHDVAVEKGWV